MGRFNATACYRELGSELRKRREAANVSAAQIAHKTGWDRSRVSRIESGHIGIDAVEVILYLGACRDYEADVKELVELCHTARENKGYWLSPNGEWLTTSLATLVYHESTADRLISFEPLAVPGLLQTPSYARAVISPGAARMGRPVDEAVRIRTRGKRSSVAGTRSSACSSCTSRRFGTGSAARRSCTNSCCTWCSWPGSAT